MVSAEPRVENILASIREAIDKGPDPVLKSVPAPGLAPAAPAPSKPTLSSSLPLPPKPESSSKISLQDKGTLMRGAMREFRVSFDNPQFPTSSQHNEAQISELRERVRRTAEEALSNSSLGSRYAPLSPPPPPRMAEPRDREDGFAGLLSGRADIKEAPSLAPSPAPSNATRAPSYAHQTSRYQPSEMRGTYDEPSHEPPHYAQQDPYQQTYADPYAEQVWEDQVQQPYAEPYYEEAYEEPAAPAPRYRPAPQAPTRALVSPRTERHARGSFDELAEVIMSRAGGDRGIEDMTRDLLRGLLRNWLDEHLPELVEKLVREEIERVARGR
jgi:uncharacterized protein